MKGQLSVVNKKRKKTKKEKENEKEEKECWWALNGLFLLCPTMLRWQDYFAPNLLVPVLHSSTTTNIQVALEFSLFKYSNKSKVSFTSQNSPEKPWGQRQWNPLTRLVQWPAFWHGLLVQSSTFFSQFLPMKAGGHVQW